METCPICYRNTHLESLGCQHQICRSCLTRWLPINANCPMCRAEVDTSLYPSLDISNLIDSKIYHLNISIDSPKGTSNPITYQEMEILTQLFGNPHAIIFRNYPNLTIGSKIMIQYYNSNCWFIGIIQTIDNRSVEIENCIHLQRCDGAIYNTTPSKRQINYSENDSIFLISR